MITEKRLLDLNATIEETFEYYGAPIEEASSAELSDREIEGLLDLDSLLQEIKRHHPRGIEETIDLSFLE